MGIQGHDDGSLHALMFVRRNRFFFKLIKNKFYDGQSHLTAPHLYYYCHQAIHKVLRCWWFPLKVWLPSCSTYLEQPQAADDKESHIWFHSSFPFAHET